MQPVADTVSDQSSSEFPQQGPGTRSLKIISFVGNSSPIFKVEGAKSLLESPLDIY